MPYGNGEPIVYLEDAELVGAVLDNFIEHHRDIDVESETTNVSASAAIRRAAEARHQIEKDFLPDLEPEVRAAVALGSTVLRSMARDEFAEALRNYQKSLAAESDEAKRVDYLAQQLEP
jgi:hypothetical protein